MTGKDKLRKYKKYIHEAACENDLEQLEDIESAIYKDEELSKSNRKLLQKILDSVTDRILDGFLMVEDL